MDWQEIAKNPKFQEMPYERRRRIAENYFKDQIANEGYLKLPPERQSKIFDNFLLTIGAPDSQLPQGGTLQGDGLVQRLLAQQQPYQGEFKPTGEFSFPKPSTPGLAKPKESILPKPLQQAAYGFTSGYTAGLLPALTSEQERQAMQPKNFIEMAGRGIGELGGFVAGAPVKIASKVVAKVLPKLVSPVIKQAITLGMASGIGGNEEVGRLITKPSTQELATFVGQKLLNTSLGALTGARFGIVGKLPKYWERAVANLIVGNVIGAATTKATTGELPNVQDIVYNSLMDLYFSKDRVPTEKEIEFIKNASKQVSDGLLENTVQWNKLIKDAEKYPNKDFSKDLKNAYVNWHYGKQLESEVTKLNMASLSEAEQLAKAKTVQKPKAEPKPDVTPEPVKAPEIVEPVTPVETPVVETKPTPVVKTKKKVQKQEPIITPEPVAEPTKEKAKTEIEIKSPELEKKEAQPESNYEEINGISIIKPKEVPLKAGDTHTYLNKDGTRTPVKIVGVFNLKDRIGEITGKTYYSRLVKEVIGNLSNDTKIIEIDGDIPSNGWYSRENGNIFINRKNATSNLKLQSTLAHEIVHAVTVSPFEKSRLGQALTDKEVKFRNDMLSLVNEIFPKLSEEWQGNFKKNYKSDPDTYAKEFLGYGFTNEKFIKELNKIKVEGSKSAFSKLMDLVKQFFNISESSALEKLIKTTSEYIETPKTATQKVEAPQQVKPKRSVGKGKAKEPATKVETPTEAVEEIVEGKRQSNIGTAEFKTKMLAELDKAIEKAPATMGEYEASKYKKRQWHPGVLSEEKITIEIPGDGKFTIVNAKEELQRVRDKVQKLPLSDKNKTPSGKKSFEKQAEIEREYLEKQELKKEEAKAAEISAKEPPPAKPEAEVEIKERKLTQDEKVELIKAGGKLSDTLPSNFKSFNDYIEYIKKSRSEYRKKQQEDWINKIPAREWWVKSKPKTKKDVELNDKKESAIDVIERFYDSSKQKKSDMIGITEADYKNKDIREGVMVKWEPYADQVTITIRGIVGPHNVDISDKSIQLEKGAKQFSITKSYKKLPSKEELIDDIVIYDILEKSKPVDKIIRDGSTSNIYPTARDFKTVESIDKLANQSIETKPAAKAKEPWEMTKDEFVKSHSEMGGVNADVFLEGGTPKNAKKAIQFIGYEFEAEGIGGKVSGTLEKITNASPNSKKYTAILLTKDGQKIPVKVSTNNPIRLTDTPARNEWESIHKIQIKKAIEAGKIKSHPDYPELTKPEVKAEAKPEKVADLKDPAKMKREELVAELEAAGITTVGMTGKKVKNTTKGKLVTLVEQLRKKEPSAKVAAPKPQTIEYLDKNQKTRTGKLVETKKNGDVLVEMADGTRVTVKAEKVKQPKTLKEVTEKLSEKIEKEEPAEDIPVGLSIKIVKSTPTKKFNTPFDNPKIETEYQQSKGVKKQSLLFRAAEKLRIFRNKTTRGAFEHLPRTKEFSILRNALQNLGKQKEVSSDKSLRILNGIIVKIKKNLDSYDVFERKVLLDDLLQESKAKRKLPGEWTDKDIAQEHTKFSKLADSDPNIKQALADRKQLWEGLKNEYIAAMDNIGFNVKNRFTKEDYFRHQVLEYANVRGLTGTGNRLRTPAGRGFLKARKGSKHSINTDYLEAEYEVMSQMLYDIERAKVIKTVDKHYNIINKIKAEAKKQGKNWEELIPEDYDLWQPREGNVLFFAHTIPERMAQELLQGVAKDINISAKDVRKILAIGGPRREFVLPKNVIEQLNNLVVNKDHSWFGKGAREIQKGWKVWTLISPRRLAKYNIRNMTGDADASFVGNPSGFKKVPQAVKELYELFYKNKQPTGNLKDWYERGGMQQLLQIQEMGEIKDLAPFVNMYNKKVDLNIFKRYFRTARKATDFREAILRYANYLDYIEQMTKSGGKPKNFGASIPEEVMALPDIKDRAFKMQNDLLGAYDDVSVAGQWLRESVYPFWSWKELNFRRYIRLFKNAANNDQLATSIGRSVLAKTPFMAMRIGKFVVKAIGLWTMLQVYNNTRYPDEERDLPQGIKRQPHIILGRNEDGTVKYFSRLGALGDFLEWFGMEEAPYTITDWLNGKRTLKETVIDMAKKPVNIIAQGIRPEFKTSAELLTGQSFYPDILKPRTARDRGLLFARSLGLENEYIAIKGLPSKGYQKSLKLSAYYEIDPYQSAYMDLYDEKDRYIKKLNGESGGSYFSFSPRSNALYNFKLAIKYGDKEAAAKYFAEYVNFGGAGKGLQQSLRMMHPLYGLKKNKEVDEQTPFINSLDEEMKHKVELALKFYNEILLKDIGEYQNKLKGKKESNVIEWK